MTDFNSVIKGLAKAITDFKNEQEKWTVVLNNGSNTYKEDFSVLLKQNIINTLFEIHESKEKILAGILILMAEVPKKKNSLSSVSLLEIEDIRNNAHAIASMEIQKSIISYSVQVNQSIEFFKTTDGQIYENQLSEAEKILGLWQKVLIEVKETIKLVQLIENNVIAIIRNCDI